MTKPSAEVEAKAKVWKRPLTREDFADDLEFYKELQSLTQTELQAERTRSAALVEALEFTLQVAEEAFADYYSAKWISGSGFNNKAQYLVGHNEKHLKTARKALKARREGGTS